MNIIKNIINIIDDISNGKYSKNNSIQKGDWIIVDLKLYKKYANKITIKHINYTDNILVGSIGDYQVKDTRISFETKDKFGLLKYNTNFIAFVFYDREYELLTKPIDLIAINQNLASNYTNKIDASPELKDILKILGWKITKKALQNNKENIY